MTNGEINLLYAEVDRLLHDICKFLHDEIRDGFISPKGRHLATSLIDRSKKQLQTISMTTSLDTTESYVDMQAYKVNQRVDSPELEVYSDVSLTYEPTSGLSVIGEDEVICPYANLPANAAKGRKAGSLYKKEKFLFFEQQKKVFATVYHCWFLVYANEHALKPCYTFDLSRYEVSPSIAQTKDNAKKREDSFDLISTTDSKVYSFTSQYRKDIQQWLRVIQQEIDMVVTKRSLPPIPTKTSNEDLSRISAELDTEEHYEPLQNYIVNHKIKLKGSTRSLNKTTEEQSLSLPPRKTNQIIPTHQDLPGASSEDSLSSNYDSVTPGLLSHTKESSNSFSEDDSDTHYDDPADIHGRHAQYPIMPNKRIAVEDDEDEIYDYLINPISPAAQHQTTIKKPPSPPPKIPNKPKVFLSFRQRKRSDV